jgi:glycosyltransferase involved in cell wall biosynthesis
VRIGLVIYGSLDTMSGGYLYDRTLVEYLRDCGDEVRVVSIPPGAYWPRVLQNLWFRLHGDFDVVLEDELCHPSLLAANAGRRSFPVVGIVHNIGAVGTALHPRPAALAQILETEYLRRVDGFIFNSSTTCKSASDLDIVPKPYVIAPPGGDQLGESDLTMIGARAAQTGPLRLVFLANVIAGKGLDVVLAALKGLSAADYELDVIGSCDVEPGYARRMQTEAASAGLAVRFRGPLDGQALTDALEHSQVLVLPSYYEGFGIALLEGMAHGLPALSTTAGAIPEIVSDGEDGFLISPGDSANLASYINKLVVDRRLLARMGIAAFHNYRSRPTWRQTTAAIRDFLVGMLQPRSSS